MGMEDYEAMNRKAKLITRQQIIRDPNTDTAQLLKHIQKPQEKTPKKKNEANQKQYRKHKKQKKHNKTTQKQRKNTRKSREYGKEKTSQGHIAARKNPNTQKQAKTYKQNENRIILADEKPVYTRRTNNRDNTPPETLCHP